MSSSVGSWYLSPFRALFSACGSMQILRSPFFFRATMTLHTQSVGSSTCAIMFIVCSLLSSIFRGSTRATWMRLVAATTGETQQSILKCATPGNLPSPSPKTSPKLMYQYDMKKISYPQKVTSIRLSVRRTSGRSILSSISKPASSLHHAPQALPQATKANK